MSPVRREIFGPYGPMGAAGVEPASSDFVTSVHLCGHGTYAPVFPVSPIGELGLQLSAR